MCVDEGANDDEGAEEVPEPEIGSAEFVVISSALDFPAYTGGEGVHPDESVDTKGDSAQISGCHIGAGTLAVVTAGNYVDFGGYLIQDNDSVDTAGDK